MLLDQSFLPSIKPNIEADKLTIGIAAARFNQNLTDSQIELCTDELKKMGVNGDNIAVTRVPGALELSYAATLLAKSKDYDAIIALACVIRGESYHFEIVSQQSAAGLMRVCLDFELPVINGILTVFDQKQAEQRLHHARYCARAAVEMCFLGLETTHD